MSGERRLLAQMSVGWPWDKPLMVRPELECDLVELNDRIFDAISLEDSFFWHDKIVERLDLEVAALLVSDDAFDHKGIPNIRKLQAVYAKQMEYLRTAIAESATLSWP
ncbi:hypothetical protein [Hyphomicrobium sp. 2TAF46]|uniref:hypothetical protein n=1 Tax=Hyphomicrobium sp. 2TAF46 TaxID=3233019 RepID=UPI003F8F6F15